MNTQGIPVTVVGWVATAPKEIHGAGVPFTSFRLATTPRRFDSRTGGWTDGRTEWFTVKAFRDVAHNVASSVRKGDPLLVHGRLQTDEWQSETGPRTTLVIEAVALGHDLSRGRTTFARTVRVGADAATAGVAGTTRVTDGASSALDTEDPWASPAPEDDAAPSDGPSDGASDGASDEEPERSGQDEPTTADDEEPALTP